MAKKDFSIYEDAKKYLRDKDSNVLNYIESMLARTNEMFIYSGLPDTLPAAKLEYYLQRFGRCFVTDKADKKRALYAFTGSYGGAPDVYGDATKIVISNTALNYSGELDINNDGVLFCNDSRKMGLYPVLAKYGAMLCDTEISLNMVSILMRVTFLLSASDDKTKDSAELFINKIINGDYSIIGETAFFDGVKMQNAQNANSALISQFIELNQYIKASAFNEIGLNANFNMKRERLTQTELDLNNNALLPFVQNMLESRKAAINKLNKMYNLNCTVELSGVWKAEKESLENTNTLLEVETIADNTNDNSEIKGAKNDKSNIIDSKGGAANDNAVNMDNKGDNLANKEDSRNSEESQKENAENEEKQKDEK